MKPPTLPDKLEVGALPDYRTVLGVRVDATSYLGATQLVIDWAKEAKARYVCVASVHGVIEAQDDPAFRAVLNGADLVTPDGMPLVWALRLLGIAEATRVYGPNLTLHVSKAAAENDVPLALYGGTPESLKQFRAFLEERFPGIRVVCEIAPPFRPLTPEEDEAYTEQIVDSGARIVFVGIGCPKQERWMAAHRDRIPGVMLGIGAAFDFHSGRVRQAPSWMQDVGLEWLFRLLAEPNRLWKRYSRIVPRFLALFGAQLLREREASQTARR